MQHYPFQGVTSANTDLKVMPPHAVPVETVLGLLASDVERGLTSDRVTELRIVYGYNELTEVPPIPVWLRLFKHFNELVIWILIAAAVISGTLGEWVDSFAILAIVLLNGILGFFQEERAGRALAALQNLLHRSRRSSAMVDCNRSQPDIWRQGIESNWKRGTTFPQMLVY